MKRAPKKRHSVWACSLMLTCCVSAQAKSEIRSSYQSNLAVETQGGDAQKFEHILTPELVMDVNDNMRLFGQLRIRYDFSDELEPTEPRDASVRSGQSRRVFFGDDGELDLRELYVDGYLGSAFYRFGKQQIVWGEADGLRVLDIINPFNFREFILSDSDDRRIPLWSANVEIPIHEWTAQFLWVLDQTYDQTPERGVGAAFEFSSPHVVPALPNNMANASVIVNDPDKPDSVFADSDVGLRLTTFKNGWDISLNYVYHYHDSQVLRREIRTTVAGKDNGEADTTVIISPDYERTHLLGVTFSNAFGDITLRGEAAYSTDRFFITSDLLDSDGVIETPEFSSVLGLDYQGIRNVFLSGQIFTNYVLDHEEAMARDALETQFTFLYEHNFMNDRLKSSAQLIHSFNDADGLLQLGLAYEYRSNIQLSTGVDVFYGDEQGLFGQFKQNNRVTVGIEVGF